jgi:hypothetical protein
MPGNLSRGGCGFLLISISVWLHPYEMHLVDSGKNAKNS